jgi:DNA-binding NarL/FixJ family response regulator
MTRLILVIDTFPQGLFITDDPRPMHELVKVINTGNMIVGLGEVNLGGPALQRAIALPSKTTVAVLTAPPPTLLTAQNYDTIYSLAQGLTLEQMALHANLSRRTVCKNLANLKERLHVSSREEILLRAVEMGIL